MLDGASFEDWAAEHLREYNPRYAGFPFTERGAAMNSERPENGDRQCPRLPAWDDDWNRTQLCDVLKTFLKSVWGKFSSYTPFVLLTSIKST